MEVCKEIIVLVNNFEELLEIIEEICQADAIFDKKWKVDEIKKKYNLQRNLAMKRCQIEAQISLVPSIIFS